MAKRASAGRADAGRAGVGRTGAPLGWTPPDLKGRVAVVTGASRGAGRGIAVALGETGATVYVAARTARGGPGPADGAPGTIEDTAEEVSARGGRGIAVRADCTDEAQVAELFRRVEREQERLDIMVSAVWGANESYRDSGWGGPFWKARSLAWHETMTAGPYAFLLASREAARSMAAKRRGLIVAVTEPGFDGKVSGSQLFWAFWTLGHHCINGVAHVLANGLRARRVAVVALAPGFMRTERVLMHLKTEKERKKHRFDKTETTEYSGRAVASLAADPQLLRRSGKLLYVGDLARDYGFKDADGKYVANFYRVTKMI